MKNLLNILFRGGLFMVPKPFVTAFAYMLLSGLVGKMLGVTALPVFYSFLPGAALAIGGFLYGLREEQKEGK